MDDRNRPEPAPDNLLDWPMLVERIQGHLYLSQLEVAARCGVARQTVSAWMNRRRSPGLKAKRALLELAAEAEVVAGTAGLPEPVPDARIKLRDAREFGLLLAQLPERAREEILDFARFKLARGRG